MFGQSQPNFGFYNNSYGQPPQTSQMGLENTSLPAQSQLNAQPQHNSFDFSNNMQNQPMGNYFGQPQTNNTQMMQDSGMQSGFMPMQSNQMNMSFQNTNPAPQMGGMGLQQANTPIAQPTTGNQVDDGRQGSSAYTSYQDLPNYGEHVDLNQVVEQMGMLFQDKAHWKSKFDAIDNLRILNKFHAKKMNEIIGVFWNYIIESFESQKTFIVKNILMFSTEAFMNARDVRLQDEVVMALIPQVLNKSISEKSIIKKEAETALCYLISNCCYDSAVITLSKCCFDKNPSICEISLATLGQMISGIGDRLPMYKFESLQILMLTLGKIMDSAKKGNMKKWATNLCVDMYRRFGRENYQELVMSTVATQNPELAQYLAKAIEDKKDVKSRDSNFHAFVQEKRKSMKMNAFGMMNPLQKANLFGQAEQPMLDKKILGENFQIPQMQQQTQQGTNNQMNFQNGYPPMNSLFTGQFGLGFPQNY